MSNFRTILTTAALASLLTTSLLVTLATVPETASAYTVRDPIYINGDADFTSVNGVTGGSGTESDPYIIEGWDIDASSAHGIWIEDVTAHFIIKDCYVHDGEIDRYGIYLLRCVNGTVTGNICSDYGAGIFLDSSSNNTLSNNSCSSSNNYDSGIRLSSSSNNNTLSDNECSYNDWGIILHSSCDNTLSNNNCSGNDRGIGLFSLSVDNTLSGNNCSYNDGLGIILYSSCNNNALSGNNCSYNGRGIYLDSSSNNTLNDNNCSYNGRGIYLYSSSSNTLSDNNCSSSNYCGVYFQYSSNNTLRNNNCSNSDDGIVLYSSCNNNTLSGNSCSGNDEGIYLLSSSSNTLCGNSFSNNNYVIRLSSSNNNTLSDNNCSYNVNGIQLHYSSNNTLSDNDCSSNYFNGIYLYSSCDNTLNNNNASSNGAYGVYIWDSTGTTIYHNIFFDNIDNHAFDNGGSENLWNASYPIGGNYWDNYTGVDEFSGSDQDQPGPDGIGDTPYEIDADSYDYYPLMELPNRPPAASFTVSPATGYVDTEFSVDASSSSDEEDGLSELEVRWDWESDGVWDTSWSVVKTAMHQYSVEGAHTITLEIRDTEGLTDSTTRQVTVVPDDVPPVAEAGPDQTLDEDTPVTFDGSDSSDNIGIVNYTWTFVDGTEKELYGVDPNYTFEDPGEYTVTLDVADAADNHDTDTVAVTVLEVNVPPVADAGPDQSVTVGEAVTFDGSDSSDNVGIENYTWTFMYAGEERELYDVAPTFTFGIAGTYVVTLTVEDAEGGTDMDTVTITVEEEEEEEQEEDEDGDDKSFIESYGFPIGIVVALVIVALILFFVLKGRKGEKAPVTLVEPPESEPAD